MSFQIQRRKITVQHFTEDLGDGIGMDMILVNGGSFTMGSPDNEPERGKNEGPQHEVTVPTFVMGRYPVTQAQWRVIAQMPEIKRRLTPNPSRFAGDKCPVEQVSWLEAVEFCDRLSKYTQRIYRLPSEAEWEYACRAGTTTPFYFGRTLVTELANCRAVFISNAGAINTQEPLSRNHTTPVDRFPANAFGFSDMHGNVWEWCQGHYHDTYLELSGERRDVPDNDGDDQGSESFRVIRGGAWSELPRFCRSACRNRYGLDARDGNIGFRIVYSLQKPYK